MNFYPTERITLKAPVKTSSGLGASDTLTWTDVCTVDAEQWTTSSNESTDDKQISLTRTQKFKIRYRTVLKPSWIIEWKSRWGTRLFNLTAIDTDKKREFVFITCKEKG